MFQGPLNLGQRVVEIAAETNIGAGHAVFLLLIGGGRAIVITALARTGTTLALGGFARLFAASLGRQLFPVWRGGFLTLGPPVTQSTQILARLFPEQEEIVAGAKPRVLQ